MKELTTAEALAICKEKGFPICGQTLRMWCHRFKIGGKIGRFFRISEEALLERIQKEQIQNKEIRDKEYQKHWGDYSEADLPNCGCGCGGKVARPQNKYINGHSGWPRKWV